RDPAGGGGRRALCAGAAGVLAGRRLPWPDRGPGPAAGAVADGWRGRLHPGARLLAAPPRRALNPAARAIHRYERVESTQLIARQLADGGAADGTVVVAAEQTGGRGRRGNAFYSPPGGLYVSIVLRPELPAAR